MGNLYLISKKKDVKFETPASSRLTSHPPSHPFTHPSGEALYQIVAAFFEHSDVFAQ